MVARCPSCGFAGREEFGFCPACGTPQAVAESRPLSESCGVGRSTKSRSAFVAYGIYLGFLGAHNYYIGKKRLAKFQFLCTVLSLGGALPFVWIWAAIELFTVDCDAKGKELLT